MKKYDNFFDEIVKLKEKQEQQKKRGLNDYNLLTAVLNPSDEVKLHSRMIASFLNIYGSHYQNSLFLELFLDSLNLEDFDIDLNSAWVNNEYSNIDIYISDGKKHIIIENKIYADDQHEQIKRYVESIYESNQNILYEDILVIYLTIDRAKPIDYSLGNWKIIDDKIVDEQEKEKAIYRNMHYKDDVLDWLKKCKNEVQNITNLNEAFEQYIQVVQMITNQYKGKVVSLESKIDNDKNYQIAREIYYGFQNIREKKFNSFFVEVREHLQNKLPKWKIDIDFGRLKKRFGFPFRVYKKEWIEQENRILFGFEFDGNDYYNARFGFVKSDYKITIDSLSKDFEKNEYQELLKSMDINSNKWWIKEDTSSYQEDFVEKIISGDVTPEMLSNKIVDMITKYEPIEEYGLITSINEYLVDKKSN